MDLDNADFRIYKGVDNKIEFLLRNTDRKAVPLVGRTVRIVFTDRTTGEVLGNPLATVVDELRGMCVLTLPKGSTDLWPDGAIRYAALVVEPDGREYLLFVDQNQKSTAFCYVMASPVQAPARDSGQVYNFPILRSNETQIRRLQLIKDGVALNTLGYTFRMQIRTARSTDPTTLLQDLTLDNGNLRIVTEGSNVFLEMRIGPFPTVTTRIDAYYDLIATKAGDSLVWLEGTMPLEPGVTI